MVPHVLLYASENKVLGEKNEQANKTNKTLYCVMK